MSMTKEVADGLSAQIEKHLESAYRRGWNDAMKYAQKDEKAKWDKSDEFVLTQNTHPQLLTEQ